MAGSDAFAVDGRGRGGGCRSFRLHVFASWRQFAIGALFLVCLVALVVCLGSSRLSPYRCDLGLSLTLTTFLLMLCTCIYFFYHFFSSCVVVRANMFYDYVYTIKLYKATMLHLADTHRRCVAPKVVMAKCIAVHIARINHIKESDCG